MTSNFILCNWDRNYRFKWNQLKSKFLSAFNFRRNFFMFPVFSDFSWSFCISVGLFLRSTSIDLCWKLTSQRSNSLEVLLHFDSQFLICSFSIRSFLLYDSSASRLSSIIRFYILITGAFCLSIDISSNCTEGFMFL